ncbi:MAG TPA: hypothetical protein VGN21_17975 [Stellaceae bacterium]|jgi:hypothetical protein
MAIFRCYFLDSDDRIRASKDIDAGALDQAVEQGLAMLRQTSYETIELWQGATKVFPVSSARPVAAEDG